MREEFSREKCVGFLRCHSARAYTGEFEKIDVVNNTWSVADEEGNRVLKGGLSARSRKTLQGGIVGVQKYRFEIEEKLEEVSATGKEVFTRTLIDYEAIA